MWMWMRTIASSTRMSTARDKTANHSTAYSLDPLVCPIDTILIDTDTPNPSKSIYRSRANQTILDLPNPTCEKFVLTTWRRHLSKQCDNFLSAHFRDFLRRCLVWGRWHVVGIDDGGWWRSICCWRERWTAYGMTLTLTLTIRAILFIPPPSTTNRNSPLMILIHKAKKEASRFLSYMKIRFNKANYYNTNSQRR